LLFSSVGTLLLIFSTHLSFRVLGVALVNVNFYLAKASCSPHLPLFQ
jgi:hypothetical protein